MSELLHVKGRRFPFEMPENLGSLSEGGNWELGCNMSAALEAFQWQRLAKGYGPERIQSDMLYLVEACLRISRLCESPIEQQIVPWLLCEDYGDLGDGMGHSHIIGVDRKLPNGLAIIPQMSFGRSRFDFMLLADYRGHRKMIAFECDGAQFHTGYCRERRDWDRDDYMLEWHIETIRASGKEIKHSPKGVALHIATRILEWGIDHGMPVLVQKQMESAS